MTSRYLVSDKTHFLVFYLWPFGLCISDKTLFLVFDILLLGVWISDKTLLEFDILLLGVWISDETLLLVFYILLLDVWISDKTLLLMFDISPLVVWISDETPLLMFDIFTSRCLDIVWNSFPRLWCTTSLIFSCNWRNKKNHSLLSLKLLRVWTTAVQQDCNFLFWANEIKLGFSNDLTTSYLSFSLNEDIKSVWLNSG